MSKGVRVSRPYYYKGTDSHVVDSVQQVAGRALGRKARLEDLDFDLVITNGSVPTISCPFVRALLSIRASYVSSLSPGVGGPIYNYMPRSRGPGPMI